MVDEYERKLRKLARRSEEESTEEDPGEFELPTDQIQNFLGELSRVAREYHIILPPPFSPFEFLPKLPAATKQHDSIEKISKAPSGPKTEEEVTELSPGDVKAVEILAREGIPSDRIASTLRVPIRLVLKALEKPEVKPHELGTHSSSSYSRR